MAENQNDAKDARIAELEEQLAAAQAASEDEAPKAEKVVTLKHKNGTKVHVGASQVDGLKSAGYSK